MNDFLGLVVPTVTRHGGHANKFVGDGLLAVFGAPERRRTTTPTARWRPGADRDGLSERFGAGSGSGSA